MKKILKFLVFGFAGLLGLITLVYLVAFVMARPIKQEVWYQPVEGEHKPLVMAHQAGEGEYPSNSKLGFTKAAEAGVDVLDADVLVTKDNQLVLYHDETLEHRTNGDGPVAEKTLAELQQLDFAYDWTPDNGQTYPYRGQGITVMTAEDLFTDFPDIRLGIEIKKSPAQVSSDFCEMIKRHRAEARTLISSNSQNNMEVFRRECPQVSTSATEDEVRSFYIYHRLGLIGYYRPKFSSLQVPEKSGNTTILTEGFIKAAHRRGIKVYAWTIDSAERANYLTSLGVDGLNTSYPGRILDWLKGQER